MSLCSTRTDGKELSGRLMSIDALRGYDMAMISGLGGVIAALGMAIPGCSWLHD